MMATEATQENFADASNTADKQNVLTEPQQDVPSIFPTPVNGEASSTDGDKLEKGLDGRAVQPTSAAASISGGSDTEGPKGENSKLRLDDKGHARAASLVKKPTTFKAVSVNKTFLAAKGAITTATSKLGENKSAAGSAAVQAGPSVSAAPRPRLVAKTGSGLRDSAPRSSAAANGVKPGSAPDPSAVWNKNRPAPPPEVKRLTDEDLRKQYGIHLATRIQGDDQGKAANWADIDDDEEDWAPETIEWTDGTKITLNPTEEPAPAPVEQKQPKPSTAPMSKPQSPAPPSSSTSTIKLGGITGGPGKGLVLKGASEKPTLVAKPPGPPTPVKSPWAPLPPVDKVAPVVIEPQSSQPQQQPTSRFQQKDIHGFESMPPLPTREIAADDFSRGWRDNVQSRELYNSQSGRYEPVTDNRRNSRNDVHPRQPALLQRPSNNDQSGPAEPSMAFQTHRTSGEASYGRRRNSSNVSGGSGNNMRRMSFSRGGEMPTSHEMSGPRRGSLAAVSDSPSSPRNYSPVTQNPGHRTNPGQPWQSRASPVTSHNSPSLMHSQMAAVTPMGKQLPPVEDEVELQKKVMAESREAARKRRAELAAKEEAERKERIRLKLESMGPAPESNKQKKDALNEEKATMPTHIQVRDSSDIRPKPGLPEVTGEVKESGVTKVEPSQNTAKKAPGQSDLDSQKHSAPAAFSTRTAAPDDRQSASDPMPPQSQTNSASQSWQNAQHNSRFPGWNGNTHSNTGRNVWGGHLGNGSFGLQEAAGPQTAPGPIGPPNSYRPNDAQSNRGREQYPTRPDPIAPPNGQSAAPRGFRQPVPNQSSNPWANFSIAESDRKLAAEKAEQHKARLEREAIEGVKEAGRLDTWKRVDLKENGDRTGIKVKTTIVTPATINGIPQDETAPPPGLLGTNGVRHDGTVPNNNVLASGMTASSAQRGSRFFPSRDVRLEDQNFSFGRPSSPSPPPPTMPGHPAYDGDSLHPHVSLPRPPPVVKLPPAKLAPIGPPKPAPSFAAAVAGSSGQYVSNNATAQSTRQNAHLRGSYPPSAPGEQNWQNRINDLIGRKASPPKSYALAVDSSSKHAFELAGAQNSATVTLPGSRNGVPDDEDTFASKPMSEECFEEQEMGSRPVFNFPRASTSQWGSQRPKPNPQKAKAPDVTSSKALPFYPETSSGSPTIAVLVPGMELKKSVPAQFLRDNRQKSNPRRGGQRGGSSRGNSSYTRGGRREASSNYPPSKLDNASSSSPNGHSTRGRGRGYGSNWTTTTRHASTPVTSN